MAERNPKARQLRPVPPAEPRILEPNPLRSIQGPTGTPTESPIRSGGVYNGGPVAPFCNDNSYAPDSPSSAATPQEK